MQMRDALRQVQGGSAVGALAAACGATPAQVETLLRSIASELAWAMERHSLSRNGLADVIEAVGRVERAGYLGATDLLQDEAARAEGEALLGLLLAAHARAMLAADTARAANLAEPAVAKTLPQLTVLAFAALAARARHNLGALLVRMPSLGRWSKGSRHADLADILRRRCGAGPYASGKLRRAARRCVLGAGSFGSLGVLGWYLRFLLRPAAKLVQPVLSRMHPQA